MSLSLGAALLITTLILIVGFCMFAVEFVHDIEENLKQLDDYLLNSNKRELTKKERVNVKNRLINVMTFHSEAKELSIVFFI